MKIVLIGYRGTGKSTVATMLGNRLGWPTVSTDAKIIEQAQLPIPRIVQQFGWEHFRRLESDVCESLRSADQVVIDTGGGVVTREENIAALKPQAKVFWLTASVPTICQRIGGDTQRPSLTEGKTFIQEIEEVLEQRTPLYRAASDFEISTDGKSITEIVTRVLAQISEENP